MGGSVGVIDRGSIGWKKAGAEGGALSTTTACKVEELACSWRPVSRYVPRTGFRVFGFVCEAGSPGTSDFRT